MKNKKEFFGVLISVLVCVFLVFLVVYATTVGSDITVTDDLVVTDALQVDGTSAAVAYSRFGTGTTGHGLDDANDLLISADLEVDGTAYFDGNVSLSDSSVLYTTDIVGVRDAGLYLRIGDEALTSHSLAADDDLLITGALEVDGTAYFDGNVSLSDSSVLYTTDIIGVRDTGLYLRIGDEALTSHSLAADDDMLVTGKLEVDGTAFFDGVVSVSDANGIQIGGGATITIVAASPSCDSCVVGSLFIDTTNATIHMCDATDTCTLMQKD